MKKAIISTFSSILLANAPLLVAQTYNEAGVPTYFDSSIRWLQNYSEAVALSQSSSKPILILFTGTNWCPACIMLERTVISQPEFTQAIAPYFIFLKAEFPQASASSLAHSPYKSLLDRYQIGAFPTFVVVNAEGRFLYKVNYGQGGPQAYAQELLQKLRNVSGQ